MRIEIRVEDKCFATAIYDALVVDNYFGDDTKNIREILCEYDGKIDATNRGIKSIVGIEWLRNTQEIDFTNSLDSPNPNIKNEIRDIKTEEIYLFGLEEIRLKNMEILLGDYIYCVVVV